MGSELQKDPIEKARVESRTIYVRTANSCGLVGVNFVASPDETSFHCGLCGGSFTATLELGKELSSHADMHAREWEERPHRFLIRLAHNPYWKEAGHGS